MPSLLSYRFDQLMHDKLSNATNTHCKLLSIRILVNDMEHEQAFYTQVLGCPFRVEEDSSVVLPLSEGINLVLVPMPNTTADKKEGILPLVNRVELDFETREIHSLWKNLCSTTLGQVSELIHVGKERMFKAISPSGMLLRLRQ
jgi:hypothetical protein